MDSILVRLLKRLRATKRNTAVDSNMGSSSTPDYSSPSFGYSSLEPPVDTTTRGENFQGYEGGDFGGAGAGDSWSDSGSNDSGSDSGSDGGGDGGSSD